MRPLSKKGVLQADRLVTVLEAFEITAIRSSPYLRCMQTVEPLARARGMKVVPETALAEGHGLAGAMEVMSDPELGDAVLCTHGDIVWEIAEELVRRRVIKANEGGFEKGSTWRLEVAGGVLVKARFIPAP